MSRLATSAALHGCRTRRRCFGSRRRSPTESRTEENNKSARHSHDNGHDMQGRLLQRVLSDDLHLVLCISPYGRCYRLPPQISSIKTLLRKSQRRL